MIIQSAVSPRLPFLHRSVAQRAREFSFETFDATHFSTRIHAAHSQRRNYHIRLSQGGTVPCRGERHVKLFVWKRARTGRAVCGNQVAGIAEIHPEIYPEMHPEIHPAMQSPGTRTLCTPSHRPDERECESVERDAVRSRRRKSTWYLSREWKVLRDARRSSCQCVIP